MKRITGLVLALSLVFNCATAALCALLPETAGASVVSSGSSQLSKLFSSVFTPITNVDSQLKNDNPLTPNILARSAASGDQGGAATASIITASGERSAGLRSDDGGGKTFAAAPALSSCDRQKIFPPPGLTTCVNSQFLTYLVFLAKSNLPWEIVVPCKGS